MTIYLLDTNICIAIMGRNAIVRGYVARAGQAHLAISTVILHELEYGVQKSRLHVNNANRLTDFLAEVPRILDFTVADAREAARIRAELEARKEPIGPYDTLIAGQAMARGFTLVTANVREFERVRGLRWEDWALL